MPSKRLLKQQDRKFQLLFDEHPHPMWIVDPVSRTVLEANVAAAVLYGYSQREFRGMKLGSLEVRDLGSLEVRDQHTHSAPVPTRHRTRNGGMIEVEIATHTIQYGGK